VVENKEKTQKRLSSLSFFAPCYNEEKNVESIIIKALEVLPRVAERYEIIIVNDGSRDKTAELAQNLADIHREVRVVNHPINKGYGAALITGFSSSQYEWVFFTDGDLQFDLNQISDFLPFTDSHKVIIGYRKRRAEGGIRAINARLFKFFVDILFQLHVKDIDCAFKLFKNETLKEITMESYGSFINAEFLYKLKRGGYKFKELPVDHYVRKHGNPTGANLKVIFKAGKELLRSYYRLKLGRSLKKR